MKILKVALLAAACPLVWGCGPRITESRMGYAPPRPENCDVKVVNLSTTALVPGGDYELVGSIVVQSGSNQDPFNEEMLAQLRPRVCRMGGEELSLGISSNTGGGSATIYNVVKKKGGGAPAPTVAP